jgi:hypothetical protein
MTTDGTAKFQAANPENVKGTIHATSAGSGKSMTMDISVTSHYLSSSCGELK